MQDLQNSNISLHHSLADTCSKHLDRSCVIEPVNEQKWTLFNLMHSIIVNFEHFVKYIKAEYINIKCSSIQSQSTALLLWCLSKSSKLHSDLFKTHLWLKATAMINFFKIFFLLRNLFQHLANMKYAKSA